MNINRRTIYFWASAGLEAIDRNWTRCDQEDGRECRGLHCRRGEHQACYYFQKIMEHVLADLKTDGKTLNGGKDETSAR